MHGILSQWRESGKGPIAWAMSLVRMWILNLKTDRSIRDLFKFIVL